MKVLVPIDNRPSSQAILDALIAIKWHPATEISLITVVPNQAEHFKSDGTPSRAIEELESLIIDLQKVLPQCSLTFFVREGDPQAEIISFARQAHADLILTGANCKSSVERLLLGSVSQAVLNGAHCPVIVARSQYNVNPDAQGGFTNVLIAIDDSAYSDAAVQWLGTFAWLPQTRFTLLAVIEDDDAYGIAEDSLRRRADELSIVLQTNNISTEITRGRVADCILQLADMQKMQLIVVGSHGRTGVKKLVLGSVAQQVAQQAPCSVVVVRDLLVKDENWQRTGSFEMPEEVEEWSDRAPTRDEPGPPHVMPGGMI